MLVIIKLLLAHFIGDFVLQPLKWVKDKEDKKLSSPALYYHILIHGLLAALLLWDSRWWLPVLLLMIIHGAIDILKIYFQKEKSRTLWFVADQVLHILSIFILAGFWWDYSLNLSQIFYSSAFWIYITSFIFLTRVSGIIMQVLMSKWELEEAKDNSLKNAGKYIGILERLFVFVFIVTRHWEGIGFLLAAKSIFRFGDLKEAKDRKLTEYILIGTLLSFALATATGLVVLYLL